MKIEKKNHSIVFKIVTRWKLASCQNLTSELCEANDRSTIHICGNLDLWLDLQWQKPKLTGKSLTGICVCTVLIWSSWKSVPFLCMYVMVSKGLLCYRTFLRSSKILLEIALINYSRYPRSCHCLFKALILYWLPHHINVS